MKDRLNLPHHKAPALGVDMKRARAMLKLHNDDPFKSPNNGIMPPAVFEDFAGVACFGDEQPPEGCVELVSKDFAARVFVRLK